MKIEGKGILQNILNIMLNILISIFSVILLISLYNNIQIKLFGKDYSDFFGYSVFEVQTGSMKPEINPGDWIIVKATQDINLKDIVTFRKDGEFITHRVIGTYNETYVTKGDANTSKDDPIDKSQIVGKVTKILPNFGIFKKTIFNPLVLISIIITIFICNIVFKDNLKNSNEKELIKNIKGKVLEFKKKILTMLDNQLENKKNKDDKSVEEQVTIISNEEEAELEVTKEIEIVSEEKILDNSLTLKEEAEGTWLGDYLQIEKSPEKEEENIIERNIIEETNKEEKTKLEVNDEIKEQEEITDSSMDEYNSSFIPVDISDLDNTFLEIAQNEIKEDEVHVQKTEEIKEEIKIDKPSTKINLDLLENTRKSKNIIDKFISIKIEEINEIINVLDDDGKTYTNEPTIKNSLISAYVDSKYYNYYGELESSNKKQSIKIEKYLKDVSIMMKRNYEGTDNKYDKKLDRFLEMFIILAKLEQVKNSIQDKRAKEEYYKKELIEHAEKCEWTEENLKEAVSDILKIQRNYVGIYGYLFKKVETNLFEIEYDKIKNRKGMYLVSLQHNISFSKVYSDYIIEKTYNEGIVAENKMIILMNLLSLQIVKDMMDSDFNNKYLVYLPTSLYYKEKKLEKILRNIDDERAKECVEIIIDINQLVTFNKGIERLKKRGYNFSLLIDEEINIDSKKYLGLNIAEHIFIDQSLNKGKIVSYLPSDLTEKIIYTDIKEKIGSLDGE